MFLLDSAWQKFAEEFLMLLEPEHLWWLLIPVIGLAVRLILKHHENRNDPDYSPISISSIPKPYLILFCAIAITIILVIVSSNEGEDDDQATATNTLPIGIIDTLQKKADKVISDSSITPSIAEDSTRLTCEFLSGTWASYSIFRMRNTFNVRFKCVADDSLHIFSSLFPEIHFSGTNFGKIETRDIEGKRITLILHRKGESIDAMYIPASMSEAIVSSQHIPTKSFILKRD